MNISIITGLVIAIFAAGLLAGAFTVVRVARSVARGAGSFGKKSPKAVFREVAVSCAVVAVLTATQTWLQDASARPTVLSLSLDLILGVASFLLIPFWAACRLSSPQNKTGTFRVSPCNFHLNASLKDYLLPVFFVGLAAFCAKFLIALPVGLVLFGGGLLQRFKDNLISAFLLCISVTGVTLFLRGTIEYVIFVNAREYAPAAKTSISIRIHKYYGLLIVMITLALGLWLAVWTLYLTHPERLFLPFGTPQKSLPLMVLPTVPPISILLIGLLVAVRRVNSHSASAFSWLCLLFGLWGMDLYPLVGAEFFWGLHLVAWVLVAPVLLHFTVSFPQWEQVLSPAEDRQMRNILIVLYFFYGLVGVVLMAFSRGALRFLSQFPAGAITISPLVELLQQAGPLVIIGVFLIGMTMLCSAPWALLIGLFSLYQTFGRIRSLDPQRVFRQSSGCVWVDLVENRIQSSRQRTVLDDQKGEIKTLQRGLLIAFCSFGIWLLLFPFIQYDTSLVPRSALLVLCLSILIAVCRHRLWGEAPESLWTVCVTLVFWLSTVVTRRLATVLAMIVSSSLLYILLLVLLTILPPPPIPRFIYSILKKSRYQWHQHLRDLADGAEKAKFTPGALIQILELMKPEAVSAHWLLLPEHGSPDTFQVYPLQHIGHVGQHRCGDLFRKALSSISANYSASASYVVLNPDLTKTIRQALTGEFKSAILTRKLLQVQIDFQGENDKSPHSERWPSLRQIWPHLRIMRKRVTDQTWKHLQEHRIALIVPFGEVSNHAAVIKAAWILGGDGCGDDYDYQDQVALEYVAETISNWIP